MQNQMLDWWGDDAARLGTLTDEVRRLFLTVAEAKARSRAALLRQAAEAHWERRRFEDSPPGDVMELPFESL